MHTSANFVLRGGDAAFANRQKLLFDQLSIAEGKHNRQDRCEDVDDDAAMHADANEDNRYSIARNDLMQKRETKKFRGKESIFKRPDRPAPRSSLRNIPDHHKNPHKWTKYSLDDVSINDMTDQSNAQAAMSFLRELKARRKKEKASEFEEKMDVESDESNARDQHNTETTFRSKRQQLSSSQIVFRKPQTEEIGESSRAVVTEPDEKPVFRSSKIIMPEYVIGQKPKKVRKHKQPVVKAERSKELKLDHLEEPDDEEEEEEDN